MRRDSSLRWQDTWNKTGLQLCIIQLCINDKLLHKDAPAAMRESARRLALVTLLLCWLEFSQNTEEVLPVGRWLNIVVLYCGPPRPVGSVKHSKRGLLG